MAELLCEAKRADQVSLELDVAPRIVFANLIRMHHQGIVHPIASRSSQDGQAWLEVESLYWDLTPHARTHSYTDPRCRACQLRERYLLINVALVE